MPAWAVNQAARADTKAAKALVKAGEKLAAAQEATLSGKRSPDLREAVAAHGEAVERMMEPVAEALGKAASAANLDRARETLRAVAGDDELRGEFEVAQRRPRPRAGRARGRRAGRAEARSGPQARGVGLAQARPGRTFARPSGRWTPPRPRSRTPSAACERAERDLEKASRGARQGA